MNLLYVPTSPLLPHYEKLKERQIRKQDQAI